MNRWIENELWRGRIPFRKCSVSVLPAPAVASIVGVKGGTTLAAENTIEIRLDPADMEIYGVELALYREQPDINK